MRDLLPFLATNVNYLLDEAAVSILGAPGWTNAYLFKVSFIHDPHSFYAVSLGDDASLLVCFHSRDILLYGINNLNNS